MSEAKNQALKSIFKGGSIVLLGTVVSKVLGLAYRVLVGRYLGPADYGVISVMMSVFSVATTFAYMGVPNGVQRYLAFYRGKGDMSGARGAVRTGLKLITAPSSLIAVLLYALAPILSEQVFHEPNALWPIRMVAIVIPFRSYTMIFTRITNAFEKMQYSVYVGKLWINIVKIVVAGILVYLGYGYLGAAFGFAVGFGSAAFLAFYFANKVFPGLFSPSKPARYNYSELFHHSWPLLAGGVFGVVIGHIDTFMLQSFLGSEEVGLYQAAYPFAMLLTVASSMFGSIVLSNASKLISQGEKKQLSSTYRAVVKWISLVSVPMFAVLMVFPRTALTIFGKEYFAVGDVLRVLLIGFFLSTINGPVGQIYQAAGRTKLNLISSIVVATVNGVLNYVLIPVYGVMGAALASTASFVATFLISLFFITKILGRQPFRFSVLKTWLAAAIAIGSVYGLTNLFFTFTPVWFFIVDLLIFTVVYLAAVLLLRTIDDEDLIVLRAIRRKFGIRVEWVEELIRKFK